MPLLEQKLIERTIPEKPNSRLQKYRLTEKGSKLIGETKGTKDMLKLRPDEAYKIKCGKQHFEALGDQITYEVVTSAREI